MTDETNNPPIDEQPEQPTTEDAVPVTPVSTEDAPQATTEEAAMEERVGRLGGEPAPVITPEEFARLQKAGQVHIDARGRVRTSRRSDADAGVSLRKRRAWY
jgi:hypothetical protein